MFLLVAIALPIVAMAAEDSAALPSGTAEAVGGISWPIAAVVIVKEFGTICDRMADRLSNALDRTTTQILSRPLPHLVVRLHTTPPPTSDDKEKE